MTNPSHNNTFKHIECPNCGGISLFSPSNSYRPFCSLRCKNIDLGCWANEDFRVPARVESEDLISNSDDLK